MFTENNPYKRYRQTQVQTAGPLELIVMMYDGVIRFCNQAETAIEARNYVQANRMLQRAQDIIDELNINLNMGAGEIAVNLRDLYEFINNKLVEANIKKDRTLLKQMIDLLAELRSSWVELQTAHKQVASVGK